MKNLLGLYEKALPKQTPWQEKLAITKKLGFDFMEISIDESDERLNRLYWNKAERLSLRQAIEESGIPLKSMCFSGHRRFPLGSRDEKVREKALELMKRAVEFASMFGVRVIQMAGYDVYYEEQGADTEAFFIEGLRKSAALAERHQIMLGIEIMDTSFLNSITKYLKYDKLINSPWLGVYPDIGNLSAWNNDVAEELSIGRSRIVGVHVKETLKVSDSFPGKFRDTPFGEGTVDFIGAFQALKRLHYTGPLLIEMWGDNLANPEQEIRRSRQFVLEKLAESGFAV
jgi:hexulose-6-phosphate isomerase